MRVVCFAMGPAQVLLQCAAVRSAGVAAAEVRMVLYGDRPAEKTRRVMECVARTAAADVKVVWADDVLDYDRLRRDPPMGPVAAALRERIGCDRPDEIWVCRLAGRPEQVAMAAYPSAGLVLCEDGLATYITYPRRLTDLLVHPRRVGRSVRNAGVGVLCRLGRFRRSSLYRWPIRPVTRAHLLLVDLLEVPATLRRTAIEKIDGRAARSVIADVLAAASPDVGPSASSTGARRVLMMGQCFSRWGTIDRDVELAVYRDVCRELTEGGFEILWKEHPKADRPFFEELSREFEQVTEPLAGLSAWPIEVLAPRLDVQIAVSLTSTAVLTLRAIHGIRGYTMARRLQPHLSARRAENERYAARFMARHVADVEDLLADRAAVESA